MGTLIKICYRKLINIWPVRIFKKIQPYCGTKNMTNALLQPDILSCISHQQYITDFFSKTLLRCFIKAYYVPFKKIFSFFAVVPIYLKKKFGSLRVEASVTVPCFFSGQTQDKSLRLCGELHETFINNNLGRLLICNDIFITMSSLLVTFSCISY